MSVIELIFFILTVVFLGLGALFGALRGRNRSALCLALTLVCAFMAFFLCGTFTNFLLKQEITINGVKQGATLEQFLGSTISGALAETVGNAAAPATTERIMSSIVMPTAKSILNLAGFVVVFFVLAIVAFIAYFPLKRVVKCEEKKQIALGIPLGVLQGLVVALCICGPYAGLASHSGRLVTTVENVIASLPPTLIGSDENPLDALGEVKADLSEFERSFIGKSYTAAFKAPFNAIATANGGALSDTLEAVDSIAQIAGSVAPLATVNFEKLDISDPAAKESIKTMFAKIDEVNEQTSAGAKEVVNTVISIAIDSVPVSGNAEMETAIKKALKEVDYSDIKLADEFEVFEQFQSLTLNYEEITKEDVASMVEAFSSSELMPVVLKELENSDIVLDDGVKAHINEAIKDLTFTSAKEREIVEDLKKLLGL